MLKLKIKEKEYKLKFGYKSFKNSGILKEVIEAKKMFEQFGAENTDEEDVSEESAGLDNIEMLEKVFGINSKMVLAALQKSHEEFRVDYKNSNSVQEAIERVDDLMDDYMDEDDAMPIMDLFNALVEQLFDDGFLSKKSEKPETETHTVQWTQEATAIPATSEAAENKTEES